MKQSDPTFSSFADSGSYVDGNRSKKGDVCAGQRNGLKWGNPSPAIKGNGFFLFVNTAGIEKSESRGHEP
jgi:hypothetical protein